MNLSGEICSAVDGRSRRWQDGTSQHEQRGVTLIVDSHCHAWRHWPYEPSTPDRDGRGQVEQLLYEMDANGVDQALIVSAEIAHNPHNNAYIAKAVNEHSNRLHQVADVDSMWKATYHQPGAAGRLQAAVERWPIKGFTHYLEFEDDGSWLSSEEGIAFFALAAENKLIASLHCHPHQQAAIRHARPAFSDDAGIDSPFGPSKGK